MSPPRKVLLVGGVALALWGMAWGLVYAIFLEHQILDEMGGRIVTAFVRAAERNPSAAQQALADYAQAQFRYVRQVDVHSHWIGLAMILIVLALVFDRVAFDQQKRLYLAVILVTGSAIFPLGVILQTLIAGPLPSIMAILGPALVIAGLAGTALGLARAHRFP
jgi:dipeptide/tripeptide permease